MSLEKIGAFTENLAKSIFGKTLERKDIYEAGNSFVNNTTKKRFVVTGTFNGVVEYVELDLKDHFEFKAMDFVSIEKNKTPMENFEKTLLDLGYQL